MNLSDQLHVVWDERAPVVLDGLALAWLEERLRFDTFRLDRPHEVIVGRRVVLRRDGETAFLRLLRFRQPAEVGIQLLASSGAKQNKLYPNLRLQAKEFLANVAEQQSVAFSVDQPLVSLSDLIAVGAHLGRKTQQWNPRMKPYILGERGGNHILDLRATIEYLNEAHRYLSAIAGEGGTVLFVGTSRMAKATLTEQAEAMELPYVTHKWLGGMLTNWRTTSGRLARLRELQEADLDDLAATKKERILLARQRDRLNLRFGGLLALQGLPDALWVVDAHRERLAVSEARRLGIPVVAMLDTDANPDTVDVRVPANPASQACVELITRVLATAIVRTRESESESESAAGPRPLDRGLDGYLK